MVFSDELLYVLKKLENAGFKAYVVGGYVRDSLRGKKPHDIDVTTDALTTDIKRIFAGKRQLEYGEKHGTVTVFVNHMPIEITTFRSEGEYKDHRHPQVVKFEKDIKKDLNRRDFTINAMAIGSDLSLYDPFGGNKDLKDNIIRAVGDPQKRFDEDALRIIRAFRFMAQLNFAVDKNTLNAACDKRKLLDVISNERVRDEFYKLMTADCPGDALVLMSQNDILDLGRVENVKNKARIIDRVKNNTPVRFFVLLSEEDELLKRLAPDKRMVSLVKSIKEASMSDFFTKSDIKRSLRDYSHAVTEAVLQYRRAVGEDTAYMQCLLSEIISHKECTNLKMLELNGADIKKLPLKNDKDIGRILNQLLDCVIEGTLENNKEALLNKALTLL